MNEKYDISRELEYSLVVPVDADEYLKVSKTDEDKTNLNELIAKAAERLIGEDGTGYKDVSVEIDAVKFRDCDHNDVEVTPENAGEIFAEFEIGLKATQEGKYTEGYPSNDYYVPDDPPELEAYDEEETKDDIYGLLTQAFNECDLPVLKSNIEMLDDGSVSWESAIENLYDGFEAEAERAAELRYESQREMDWE